MSPFFMLLLYAAVIVAVVLAISHGRNRAQRARQKRSGPPIRVDRTCPFCGGTAFRFVDPQDPPPYHFVCPECRREFGDKGQMTPQEEASIRRVNEDCARAETLYNLKQIQQAVLECTRSGNGFVTFQEDGRITWQSNTIQRFESPTTQAGRLHLATLCMAYCKANRPGLHYWLMDSGLGWE